MFKTLATVALSLTLTGCGSSSSSDPANSNNNSNTATDATLSKIAGVWDASTTIGQVTDEFYSVIRNNGTFTDYDYLGDSFDMGPNCYLVSNGTISDQGNGNFTVDGSSLSISINETVNPVTITVVEGNQAITLTKLTRLESSFTPTCP